MTRDLLQLADWLRGWGVTHLAMEATGVYWKLVWNILEGEFEVMLVNAQHIKRVPGRKTDVKDCEWIAELLQHGLVQAGFVLPAEVRELRALTRYRATLVQEGARVVNRIEKVLEDANLKLASVVTDILGVSGRAILQAIVRGEEDPERLAEMARCRLRAKLPALREALRGRVTEHHRFLLGRLLEHVRFLDSEIAELEARIAEQMRPFEKEVDQWSSIPGVNEVAAWSLVAELGPRLEAFSSERHLSSWAGMCPGSDESAGKRRSGKMRKGNPWVRRILCQVGWGAARSKGTYLSAKYHRIAARRGKKRAVIAVARNVLVIGFHLIGQPLPVLRTRS
jgi:transposase